MPLGNVNTFQGYGQLAVESNKSQATRISGDTDSHARNGKQIILLSRQIMKDEACTCFLQWALPYLQMRWSGFRKVQGQVCKRLYRRLEELSLSTLKSYRMYLENNPQEWHILDSMCRITISRFYRDTGIFNSLRLHILPNLIEIARRQGDKVISCWCIGAASGEEPYSMSLLWDLSGTNTQGLDLKILATEVDQSMIQRAKNGCYPESSIRELPSEMKAQAFIHGGAQFCIKEQYKKRVQFRQQDIRNEQPGSSFQLILCRNLVFTYFSSELQEELAQKIFKRLQPGGYLILGTHEKIPGSLDGLISSMPGKALYRREA